MKPLIKNKNALAHLEKTLTDLIWSYDKEFIKMLIHLQLNIASNRFGRRSP